MRKLIFLTFLSLAVASIQHSPFDVFTKRGLIERTLPKNVEIRRAVTREQITQRVDHFNPQDQRTFEHFYTINEENFQPGGPLIFFFYLSPANFEAAGRIYASTGPIFDLSAQLNGTIIAPSHRYFESRVTEDLSDENLRFLSVAQALEDFAHLISALREREDYRNSGESKARTLPLFSNIFNGRNS